MVDVAQLVEPRIVIPVVAGSIPVVHPINCLYKSATYYFFKKISGIWKYFNIIVLDATPI